MLRIFRLRARVVFHLRCPLQEAQQLFSLAQQESPEFKKADLVHLEAAIGFHAPAQVGAAPGREAVSARGIP